MADPLLISSFIEMNQALIAKYLGLFAVLIIWTAIWKGIALWKPQKFSISDGCQKSKDF